MDGSPAKFPCMHDEKLLVKKTATIDSLRVCREFLKKDPIANVLQLDDLYSPLLQVSDVYSATQDDKIFGVYSVCRAFSTLSPSFLYLLQSLNTRKSTR